MAVIDEKFFVKERFMKDGVIKLHLLKPVLEHFVRRMGMFDKKSICNHLEFIVELLHSELGETVNDSKPDEKPVKAKAKKVKEIEVNLPEELVPSDKQEDSILPEGESSEPAISED